MAATAVPGGSWVKIGRFFYSDPCPASGSPTGYIKTTGEKSASQAVPSNWTLISQTLTAPSNAQCVRMLVEVNSGTDGNLDVYVDGLALNSTAGASTGPFFADGFEGGNMSSWSSVAQ